VLDEIMARQGQSVLARLRNGTEIFNFLNCSGIYSMDDLEKKLSAMQSKLNSVREGLKKTERRISTLKEHIAQSEHFKNNRKLKLRYDELYSEYEAARKSKGIDAERKARKALDAANRYYESNRAGLALFDSAARYLRDALQGRYDPKKLPPTTMWRQELAEKTAEKDALYREYYALKDETAKVEKIQRGVKEILHSDELEQGRMQGKSRGAVL